MRHLFLLCSILFLFACGGKTADSANNHFAEAEQTRAFAQADEEASGGAHVPPPIDRKIIRTGNLTFEVDDLDLARGAVLERVKTSGGYVEGDDRGEWGNLRSVTLRVRIPAEGFDAFVDGLGSLGRLEHRSINATDVTSEWVDVEARLGAKRTVEKRYLELAGQAKNVQEMLEVERELGNVRAEIESMEARMKVLRDQVAMSTLTVTCNKRVASTERFSPRFGVALEEGWNNLVRFALGLTHLWPFVLILGVLIWWWRRRRAIRRRAKT